MLGRYILITLGVIALLWTGYVAFDLIDKKNELSPRSLFGLEDEKVLIIHRAEELNWSSIDFKTSDGTNHLLNQMTPFSDLVKAVYVSNKREHLLFEGKTPWDKGTVKQLFSKFGKADFDGVKHFKIADYNGRIYRNKLYLSRSNYTSTTIEHEWDRHDKKSSASIVSFSKDQFTVTDIYFKQDGRIEYIAQAANDLEGDQVNDKELFAHALPKELTNYHFFENKYLNSVDPVFSEGPVRSWIDKGLVLFQMNGKDVLVTDYRQSQDPVNSLFDFTKKDPLNQSYGFFQNMELLSGFPKEPKKGFYAYSMDDFVVISADQAICERVVAEYKLGNTLIQSKEKMELVYGKLPAKVSERFISNDRQISKTVKNGWLISTVFPLNGTISDKDNDEQDVSSFKMGATIHDLLVDQGNGNFYALTKTGIIRSYRNGKKQWEKNLATEPIGTLQKISFMGRNFILITNKNGIHLYDETGNAPNGFPIIVADRQLASDATVYNWKNKSYLIGMNATGDLLVYDQNGKRINMIVSGLATGNYAPEVWISQRKLFYGVRDDQQFRMYDAETKKEYRSFKIPERTFPLKKPNELFFITLDRDNLERIDQKGNRTSLVKKLEGFKIFQIRENFDVVLFKNQNIRVYDESGRIKLNIESSVTQADHISFSVLQSGISILSIVDGLHNDVYLYTQNGVPYLEKPLSGSKKALVTTGKEGNPILTTIIDDFIVQYSLK